MRGINNLTIASQNLPANIEELARFILVAQEKLVSVRAEIRAMKKTGLLKEIIEQKREEARMVSEALLDAQTRFGDITRPMEKASGGDRRSTDFQKSMARTFENVDFQNPTNREFENNPKSKLDLVKSLGFSKQRVSEFETLANNPDIVEQVKAEARANDDLPTRSRVLQLVKEKNKSVEQPSIGRKQILEIHDAITKASTVSLDPERMAAWLETLTEDEEINFNLMMIDDAIVNLRMIKVFITKNRRTKI